MRGLPFAALFNRARLSHARQQTSRWRPHCRRLASPVQGSHRSQLACRVKQAFQTRIVVSCPHRAANWHATKTILLSVATVSHPSPCWARRLLRRTTWEQSIWLLVQRLHMPPAYAGMSQKRSGRRCKPSTRSEGPMRSAAMAPSEANGVTSLFMAGSHTCRPVGFSRRPPKPGICLTAAFTLISRVHSRVGQAALLARGQRRSAQGRRGQPSESGCPTTR